MSAADIATPVPSGHEGITLTLRGGALTGAPLAYEATCAEHSPDWRARASSREVIDRAIAAHLDREHDRPRRGRHAGPMSLGNMARELFASTMPPEVWPDIPTLPDIALAPEFATVNPAQSSHLRTDERKDSMASDEAFGSRDVAREREPFEGASSSPSTFDQDARDAQRLGDLDLSEWIAKRSVADVRATLTSLQGVAREHDDRASAARSLRRQLYGLLGELASNPDEGTLAEKPRGIQGPF